MKIFKYNYSCYPKLREIASFPTVGEKMEDSSLRNTHLNKDESETSQIQRGIKGRCSSYDRYRNIFIPYNPKLKELARDLRRHSTYTEILLWQQIKNRKLGFQFHRQVPLNEFIVDFYCHDLILALEIDGSSHDSEQAIVYDDLRQQTLENLGVRFLRFTNDEVSTNLKGVIYTVENWINEHKGDITPL